MIKETNIKEIKQVAKTLLYTDMSIDKTIPFIVHHPFFNTEFFYIKENNEDKLVNIKDEENLIKARKKLENTIEKVNDVSTFWMLINKPYLPCFFKYTNEYMNEKDFSVFLSTIWTYVEFPNRDKNISKKDFVKLFKKANKKYLMDKNERKKYDNFSEEIVIYRGTTNDDYKALSWTLDENIAKFFANRWGEGQIYEAKIKKQDVLAYFDSRNEKEIVVNYEKIYEIKKK